MIDESEITRRQNEFYGLKDDLYDNQECRKCGNYSKLETAFCSKCGASFKQKDVTETAEKWVDADSTWHSVQHGYYDSSPKQKSVNHDCPRCRSNNTQSFEMAYNAGTSSGNYNASGYDYNFHRVEMSGRSFDQTNLAAYTSPPAAPRPFLVAIILTFAIPVLAFFHLVIAYFTSPIKFAFTIFVVLVLITIPYIISFFYAQTAYKAYKEKLQHWAKSWICLRCGASWEL